MDKHSSTLFLVILAILICDVISDDETTEPIVRTDRGYVRGSIIHRLGKKVEVFRSIPYARPPVGRMRFKPPVQNDAWEGVKDVTEKPNSCFQVLDEYHGNFSGSTMWNANTELNEDCLYLSVWSPKTNPPFEKKAVIVWIYGGGFYSGTNTLDIYDGDILAAENDVVVVSMQYRVAALGFLSLDTPEAPGNAGLWDQRMALEWVSRNIHNFGGDSHNVTLMGESAGAVSVGFHLLCSVCRGYFHKAILQSGGPEAHWGALSKEEMWSRTKKLADEVGCPSDVDHDRIIDCLRSKDAALLSAQDHKITKGFMQFVFVPIVDGVFLQRAPWQLIRDGMFKKVPILLGSNRNEGSFYLSYFDPIFKRDWDNMLGRDKYNDLSARLFRYYPHYPHLLNNFGQEAIKFQYTDWRDPMDRLANYRTLEDGVSDYFFVCTVNRLARAFARNGVDVYYYWFDQRWTGSPWPEWMGVMHGDEILWTFGRPLDREQSFTDGERQLSRLMMRYWTNFAKTG